MVFSGTYKCFPHLFPVGTTMHSSSLADWWKQHNYITAKGSTVKCKIHAFQYIFDRWKWEESSQVQWYSGRVGACEMLIFISIWSLFPPGMSTSLKVPLSGSWGEFAAWADRGGIISLQYPEATETLGLTWLVRENSHICYCTGAVLDSKDRWYTQQFF